MNINQIRDAIVASATYPSSMAAGQRNTALAPQASLVLALIYLGDAIRESTSDIGPTLQRGLAQVAAKISDISEPS